MVSQQEVNICETEHGNPFRITIEDDTSARFCLAECNSGGNILDMELQRLLAEGDDEATIRFVNEKVLESYRNGINVGKSEEKQTRKQPAKVAI